MIPTQAQTSAMRTRSVFSAAMRRGGWRRAVLATNASALVNCASQEYFGAVDSASLTPQVLTPVFMEEKNGTAKIVSFFAKKARGAMARYIIQNQVQEPEELRNFSSGGYRYQADQSDAHKMVFLRDHQ